MYTIKSQNNIGLNMNPDLKLAFALVKPICDSLMASPSHDVVIALNSILQDVKSDCLKEMQLYVMFPIITHLKSKELKTRYETQRHLVECIETVIRRVEVHLVDVFVKIHSCLLNLVFDKNRPGMVAQVPEELMCTVTKCLTTLMLSTTETLRLLIFKENVPLLAQTVFMSVHMAKLEKLRALRLSAIDCTIAYISLHDKFTTKDGNIRNKQLRTAATEMASNILPGVVAALQDVAVSVDNVGHAVVVAALKATHRIICLVMRDDELAPKGDVTMEDFAKMLLEKAALSDSKDVDKSSKLVKRSPEWYNMAGEKLQIVIQSLVTLQSHEHVKVRTELAVCCYRIIFECSRTMSPSIAHMLNVLITLSNDEYPQLSQYCRDKLKMYFDNATEDNKSKALDGIEEHLFNALSILPRVLNNIDSNKKLALMNLIHGYVTILSESDRLPALLSSARVARIVCTALLQPCIMSKDISLLQQHAYRDIKSSTLGTPWRKLERIDGATEQRFQDVCRLLGNDPSADLLVDQLLELFDETPNDRKEIIYVLNFICSAPKIDISLTQSVLEKYIEEDVWYLPLEIATEPEPSAEETIDVTVYNPRAWETDTVPGLFEGTVSTRYTDVSYLTPHTRADLSRCQSPAQARDRAVMSCLLTDGLGELARRLADHYQQYLLKTLCMVLERVGSIYEMIHLSGLKALHDVTAACGHDDVTDLIRTNADYFTYQVTTRLKKVWNCQSALQILTVVMEYSDESISSCLHSIISDVLIQSCDKYHGRDLNAYLQVFLTFINSISRYLNTKTESQNTHSNFDLLGDTIEFITNEQESERLLNDETKSAKEMYNEDLKKKEEDALLYDDKVTDEKPPPPPHVVLTTSILRRCLHFIPSKKKDEKLLALGIIKNGLYLLRCHDNELLPLIHVIWSPLVPRFHEKDAVVVRRAFEVVVTMAELAKDFIRSRTVKEVLPNLFRYLKDSSQDSYLKDVGSTYRMSQPFSLQVDLLTALPHLTVHLNLREDVLEQTMMCVHCYLSNKQPKPLQALAVKFFKTMLCHDYGATWHYLRTICDNDDLLEPPPGTCVKLERIVGTPYEAADKSYNSNVRIIFKDDE